MDIRKIITESIHTKSRILEDDTLIDYIYEAARLCVETYKTDGKVLLCGNGGSAADAQHIAAELSGRFYYDRDPLYAEALHVNSSYVTAVANDYSYADIYSRMVKAIGREGDVLIGISTSGNSENVVKAMELANDVKMKTIALCGNSGGKLASVADICLKIPSNNTARIQESHIMIGHILCEIVEQSLFPGAIRK